MSGSVEILEAGKAYVERGWCKGALARDGGGARCAPNGEGACAWSVEGAVFAAFEDVRADGRAYLEAAAERRGALAALESAADGRFGGDGLRAQSRAQALDWFDGAIESLRGWEVVST